jgi:hypothetical protein
MDYFDEILEFYDTNTRCTEISPEIWINSFIIKVMNTYEQDQLLIKNGLIMLLNLLMIDTPDRYNKIGKSNRKLYEEERQKFIEILKYEFS